jgi:type I restriction enzyme, S subunit
MWKTVKLGEILTFVRGLTYSKKNEVDVNGLAVLRATNVSLEHRKITLDEIRHIKTPEKLNEDKLVKVGDILMCTASGSKSHLGKIALVTEELGMAFGGFMAALRCKTSCLPEYLFYILTSKAFLKRLSSLSDGANINNLKFSQIEDFEFQLPPLAEQQRIVAKLDAAFAEIDKAVEVVVRNAENVSRLLESKIADYFSNQNCSRTVTLKDVCEATQGVQIAKSNQLQEHLDGYARYLYISDFSHDKNVKYVKNEYPKKEVFPTDIIVVNTGASAGKIFRGIPGILSNNLFKVSPAEALINADFLYLFVNSLIFKQYQAQIMRGTANPHMGHQNFLSTPIQLPEISAQQETVEMVSRLSKHSETLQKAYSRKKTSLSSLKSSLLAAELTQQSEAA